VTLRKQILGIAACVLLAGTGATSAARAAVPNDFFGLVSEDVFTGNAGYRAATLAKQQSIGVGLIRQTFHWNQIETSRGKYNFAYYDGYVAALATHGIRVLPILFDPPRFRAKVTKRSSATYPPRHFGDLGRFGAAVASRYGPNGSFWAQNPTVPKLPITAFQVWNEPNVPAYWPTGPNPRSYAKLLKATAGGIRRVDPSAEIVTAGLPDSHLSRPGSVFRYAKSLVHYAHGSFNTLAVNPYGKNSSQVVSKLRRFRSILNHGHAHSARIWVTEFGWSDKGPKSSFRAGSAGQAKQIRRTIPALVKRRSSLGLRGFVYYSWRDGAPYAPAYRDFWGLHTGLLRRNGQAKPALSAFASTIAHLR
jgi:hypothetical protein